jgi:molybdopterin converting factor small subunit
MVTIVLHSPFSQLAGQREIGLRCPPATSVGEALVELARRLPGLREQVAPGKINQGFIVMAGGRLARADSPLADGDEVLVLPPIAGG